MRKLSSRHLSSKHGARRLLAGLLSVAALFVAGGPAAADAAHDRRVLDDYLSRLAGFGWSGTVLVAEHGQVVLKKGYGLADRRRGTRNRPDTIFDIGSMSKMFTAAAILKLEAAGRLKIDDPLSNFLPDVPADKQSITLRQLLTHTSGVSGPDHGYVEIGKRQMLSAILARPLQFAPGSRWAYSNAGYVLLAAVVETASGERFTHYMAEKIFRPAGMTSTGFWGAELPAGSAGRVAMGYDDARLVADPRRLSGETWNDIGSGQIVSTVEDLFRWRRALAGGAILPEAQRQEMFTPVRRIDASTSYYDESYGLGLWVQRLADGTLRRQHGGDFLGFGSQFTWLVDRDVTILGLTNVRSDLYPTHRRADRAAEDIVSGRPPAVEPPRFERLDRRTAAAVAGTYRLPDGSCLVLARTPNGTAIGARGQGATRLLDAGAGDAGRLVQRNAASEAAIRSLYAGTPVAGLDAEAQSELREELQTLARGRGVFRSVKALGSYVRGMRAAFDDTLLRITFSHGRADYLMQWDGDTLIATNPDAPGLAALTPIQPIGRRAFVGWNIVTGKRFRVAFSPGFATLSMSSDAGKATARRIRGGRMRSSPAQIERPSTLRPESD